MSALTLRLMVALILGLILTILPLPEFIGPVRPSWMLLLILFIQFYMPNYFSLYLLFFVGVILDVLLSNIIGQHVFALTIVLWLANSRARRFYVFPIEQQMILIGLFCFLYELILVTIDSFLGFKVGVIRLILNPTLSFIVWPWVRLLCEQTLNFKLKKLRS